MKLDSRQVSPTLLRGIVIATAGLITLLLPHASLEIIRFVVAGALLASGASGLWGHLRTGGSTRGLVRCVLAIGTGAGLIFVPVDVVKVGEYIAAAYLAITALMALQRGFGTEEPKPSRRFHIARGVLLLCLAALVIALPSAMFGLVVVLAAIGSLVVGVAVVVWALRHGPDKPPIANRALFSEVLWDWLGERDLGVDRREEIADGLYFEDPDRGAKITSYIVMLLLSTALASLAILQDSTAVIIGAMLVAPLMTPIMGCAAGLVAGWRTRVLYSLGVVAASVVAAIGLAWVLAAWIPALVPLGVNSQVLSRTSPTLVDMAIAIAAGAAGAYAVIDDRVSSSLTGVAIAVALVPPLGVVGIALQAGVLVEAAGAFLLFATNLVSIILAASAVFLLVGFTAVRELQRRQMANADVFVAVVVVTLLIMLPLGLTGGRVLTDSRQTATTRDHVKTWLGPESTLQLLRTDVKSNLVDVVLTGSGTPPSVAVLEEVLMRDLGSPVRVRVELFPSILITSSDGENSVEADALDDMQRSSGP